MRLIILSIALLNGMIIMKLTLAEQGTWSRTNALKPAYFLEKQHSTVGAFHSDTGEEIRTEAVFLEWNLVDVSQEGPFEIETYQQFEIHKKGKNIVNKVATPHYQYLRYWIADE